jgi:AbrB family looped-hinge helix DNA binding protein
MYRSKIGIKGQIVIPKALRDQLDWREGDDVVFYQDNGRLTIQALPKRSLSEALARLPGLEAKVPYNSFEELLELEKQSGKERHAKSRADR